MGDPQLWQTLLLFAVTYAGLALGKVPGLRMDRCSESCSPLESRRPELAVNQREFDGEAQDVPSYNKFFGARGKKKQKTMKKPRKRNQLRMGTTRPMIPYSPNKTKRNKTEESRQKWKEKTEGKEETRPPPNSSRVKIAVAGNPTGNHAGPGDS